MVIVHPDAARTLTGAAEQQGNLLIPPQARCFAFRLQF